ncbi:MAG: hypothetical protein U0361_19760 [Nitrospiraceae bacterium]
MTLLALREQDGALQIVEAGSYFMRDCARPLGVAFAVADSLRGQGLGTILLERMALLALRHGFAGSGPSPCRQSGHAQVFDESGFSVHEHIEGGDIEVDLSLAPSEATAQRADWRERIATAASLGPLLHPTSVAIVGASRDPQHRVPQHGCRARQ